jgi:hypothetical protein
MYVSVHHHVSDPEGFEAAEQRRMTCVESVPYALEKPGTDKPDSETIKDVSSKRLRE